MSPVTRAMIMAAGFGTRMRPLTDDRPKPLVTVRGRTLLDHALDRLVAAGVTMVVINLHYRAQQVKDHLAGRRDIEIRYSLEEEILAADPANGFLIIEDFGDALFADVLANGGTATELY